ncbi:hypothetical protein KM043_018276 [Ampulex compressa]|nr:hypothetical protein KM043_018276 [Ampulex compressa]
MDVTKDAGNIVKYKDTKGNMYKTNCTSHGSAPLLSLPQYPIPKALLQVLEGRETSNDLCRNYAQCLESFLSINDIPREYYLVAFKIFLYMEQYQDKIQRRKLNMKNHKITKGACGTIIISVTGLKIDDTNITYYDIVKLQKVGVKKKYYNKIVNIIDGSITVQLLGSRSLAIADDDRFDIKFCCSNWPRRCSHYALSLLHTYNMTDLMYPKLGPFKAPLDCEVDWINKNISRNAEQQQAVKNILYKTAHPAPYILFGPPGTGKTATLVEAICQIWKQKASHRILICTPSNKAADEIAIRLLKFIPPREILRMYSSSRKRDTVLRDIHVCANFVENEVIFLPYQIFLLKKIVITTFVNCTRLNGLRLQSDYFSHIILDEVSQSTEPEALIPITLMGKKNEYQKGELHAQVVIAGDHYQLGPTVKSKAIQHLLGISILERMMRLEPYQKIDDKYNPYYITKLTRNYRSHKAILHIPNKLFYEDDLQACNKKEAFLALHWNGLKNKNFPIIFHDVHGREERSKNHSVQNIKEISVVMNYVHKLLGTKFGKHKITQADIGIVTPFKLQETMIAKILNDEKLPHIMVGTVEVFQGQEKTIIILSTVRTKTFIHDNKKHNGFLSNTKRFNVAITRAKALLIVIGNSSVLCLENMWKELWEYCIDNDSCIFHNNVKRAGK